VKFSAIKPKKETYDSHYGTCLGHLGRHDKYRIIFIGQGKYSSECRVSLLLTVLLTNYADVNYQLAPSF